MTDLPLRAVLTVTIETRKGGDYYFDHDDLLANVIPWVEGALDDRDDITQVTIEAQPPAVPVPAADRAALRGRRRQCPDREPLLDVQCVKEAGHEVHSDRPGRVWYPAPADRAAVLREAADAIDAETRQAKADQVLEPDKYRPCRDASAQLRRMADEAPQ